MKTVVVAVVSVLAAAGGTFAATRPSPSTRAHARACTTAIENARLTIIAAGMTVETGGVIVAHLDAAALAFMQGDSTTGTSEAESVQPNVQTFGQAVQRYGGLTSSPALSAFNQAAAGCWNWASTTSLG